MSSDLDTARKNERNKPLLAKADLFAFTPVPTGEELSTSRSRWGTLIFIVIYLAYIVMVLYSFFTRNVPRINQFNTSLDDNLVYTAPDMAFAFVLGDNLNESFYDPNYWTMAFQQVTVSQDANTQRIYEDVNLKICRPAWLNPTYNVLCPEKLGQLQGLLYGSPTHMYPRMRMRLCDRNKVGNTCADDSLISMKLMTGRLFVFIRQFPATNLITGQEIIDDTPFVSYYYFALMDQYNRAELKIQAENMTIQADFLTSWQDTEKQNLNFDVVNFYVSRVPQTINRDVFLWWCSMAPQTTLTIVAYTTTFDIVSKIGAMFSVIFAFFALYFLRYNRQSYYAANAHMANFDDKISPLVSTAQALRHENEESLGSDSQHTTDKEKVAEKWLRIVKNPNFEMQKFTKENDPESQAPKQG